ncbi:ABC transporter substrate-binding protein [Streptomyces ferrugineus]|uniref:ABC transporter substrate-binding protein n=1 Tax=Streptomyces ferrugineus TaxID=1413221 RepID=UPI001D158827|nr:sugar ABC transporter substrate-binding protein [Streptomyces ferrugineus]
MTIALALTACSPSGGGGSGAKSSKPVTQAEIDKAMNTPTSLTFWSWVPDIQDEIDLFEKKYPKIKVNLVNQGDANAQYVKLRAAVKAGKGVPDVAQIGYDYLPSFTQTKSLLDLTPYGADKVASEFVPGVWSQVTQNGSIWAVPQDSGPMGTLYRTDIFGKAGVSAPTTWGEFATAAQAVKKKTGAYITNIPGNDMPQTLGFFSQAGARPFGYDGKETVSIDVDNATTQRVVGYWQDLIQKDLVATDPDFTDAWYQGLSRGKYATWLTAAWGPTFLAGSAKNTSGKWRAAVLPQWKAGENVAANWGGSSDAVMAATSHPIQAYELAKFINSDPSSTIKLANEQSLYPTTTATLSNPEFTDAKSDFYGGQQVNKFFAGVSKTVPQNQKYVPFQDYVNSSYNDTLGKAIAEHGDLKSALSAWQKKLVSYAEQQGFSVK